MAFPPTAWYIDAGPGVPIYDLGATSNSSGATLASASSTVPAGALIVVAVMEGGTAVAAGTVADAASNTYTQITTSLMGSGNGIVQLFYAKNVSALSGTITYTKNVSGGAAALAAWYTTAGDISAPLDTAVTATATGTTTSPTVTSGVPTNANTFLVGIVGYSAAAGRVLTNPTTPAFLAPPTASIAQISAQLGGGSTWYNGPAAVTFAPTIATSVTGTGAIIAGFKTSVTPAGYYAVAAWQASHGYTAGQIVRQLTVPVVGNERTFVCQVAGTSAASEPAWTVTKGAKTTDNTVTWQECTGQPAVNKDSTNTPAWTNASSTVLGQIIKNVSGGADTYFICSTSSGNTGGSEPTWNKTAGQTTNDGSNVWTSIGAISAATKWAAPHARIANALAANWGAAGNDFYFASESTETQTTAATLTFPGTSASPNRLLCVNQAGTVPPVSADLRTTGSITAAGTAGTSNFIIINGTAYVYGTGLISYSSIRINNNAAAYVRLDNSSLQLTGTAAAAITMGSATAGVASDVILSNTPIGFALATQTILLTGANLTWRNTANALTGAAVPTTLFTTTNTLTGYSVFDGVDLSAAGSGKTLVGAIAASQIYNFINCKFGASSTVAATPTTRGGGKTYVSISDSANTTYRQEVYDYGGTLTTTTTNIRTGGATDGTTPIAWKVVSTANPNWWDPFECFEIAIWSTNVGVSQTASIAILSSTTLTTANLWPEAEVLTNASFPVATLVSGGTADALATGSNWATDATSSWNTSGVSTPALQTLSVTFTTQQVGWVRIRVKVAIASTTLYVDPLISGVT